MIQLKRAYDPASASDGVRYLVDRLWPRGIKKSEFRIDAWLKDVAPSRDLVHWFGHDPKKWTEFRRRYREQLDSNREALAPIRKAARKGRVTLVYGARNTDQNNALVLKEYIQKRGR